ncbi:MAG: hypothetical protein BWK80_38770 [Desulfobacteraceae bacterium IS3]|jgi:hypothetical protein|nr:MAG: hypothetical protein BWK80_38770 [Desulfobacteraceae bacterium IS3]HAO19523.1 hypothetical protein [Desulfobacteraceae bacterium]
MNSNLFGILQQLFRNDAQGLANRCQMADSFGKYLDNFAQEIGQSNAPITEEETPHVNIADMKKKRLRRAYLLGKLFEKPVSMRDDKE